jgi:phosphatidylglycerophosphate synthase
MLSFAHVRRRALRHNHQENLRVHYFSARISILITYLLAHTRLSASHITHLFSAVGVASVVSLCFTGFWPITASVVLFRLHVLLDVVDGELARYRGTSSRLAAYQDYLTHYFCYPSVLMAAGINAYGSLPLGEALIFGFVAAQAYVMGLAAKDAWYRANFDRTTREEIDEITSPVSVGGESRLSIKARIIRLGLEATNFSAFLIYFLGAGFLDTYTAIASPISGWSFRVLVLAIFSGLFILRSAIRIALVFKRRRIPRQTRLR